MRSTEFVVFDGVFMVFEGVLSAVWYSGPYWACLKVLELLAATRQDYSALFWSLLNLKATSGLRPKIKSFRATQDTL